MISALGPPVPSLRTTTIAKPRAIARAGVACFLLDALERNAHVREVVGLAR
ncbi:MAG TPA: hypothetical protein VL463_18120 [Kofleriaceae bacterium]|nr:hypothetical protein [Kofleriaceae bacterium]